MQVWATVFFVVFLFGIRTAIFSSVELSFFSLQGRSYINQATLSSFDKYCNQAEFLPLFCSAYDSKTFKHGNIGCIDLASCPDPSPILTQGISN